MSPDFFVLYGPAGSGKSEHAAEIARVLGATAVIDGWDGRTPVPDGALVIVNCLSAEVLAAEQGPA